MKIKLLLGIVGAVTILILVSFNEIVSVQSTTTSSVNDSPLFNIRTQKAVNQQSKSILTPHYLSKGLNIIQFPLRDDNRTAMIQKFLGRIRTMDDTVFNNFITMIIRTIQKEPKFHNVNTQGLLAVFYQVKNNQNILSNNDIDLYHITYGTSDTSNTICDLLNLILAILVVLYLYLRVIIMTILQPGSCYNSLWATCLLRSK